MNGINNFCLFYVLLVIFFIQQPKIKNLVNLFEGWLIYNTTHYDDLLIWKAIRKTKIHWR